MSNKNKKKAEAIAATFTSRRMETRSSRSSSRTSLTSAIGLPSRGRASEPSAGGAGRGARSLDRFEMTGITIKNKTKHLPVSMQRERPADGVPWLAEPATLLPCLWAVCVSQREQRRRARAKATPPAEDEAESEGAAEDDGGGRGRETQARADDSPERGEGAGNGRASEAEAARP